MKPLLPLEDIILPPAISWWPLAWGWWLLLAAILVTLILSFWLGRRWQRTQRLKAVAKQELAHSCLPAQAAKRYQAVNLWLKRQAKSAYPQALPLYGSDWIEFLNRSAGRTIFNDQAAKALSQGLYQADTEDISAAELQRLAWQWLLASRALTGGRPC